MRTSGDRARQDTKVGSLVADLAQRTSALCAAALSGVGFTDFALKAAVGATPIGALPCVVLAILVGGAFLVVLAKAIVALASDGVTGLALRTVVRFCAAPNLAKVQVLESFTEESLRTGIIALTGDGATLLAQSLWLVLKGTQEAGFFR